MSFYIVMKSLRLHINTNICTQMHLDKVEYKIIGLSRQKSNYILESSQIGGRLLNLLYLVVVTLTLQ